MLDPHFKSLDATKTFVGCVKVTQMVVGYDNKTLMPILVVAFQFLNLGIDGLTKLTLVDDNDDSIFWGVTSAKVIENWVFFILPLTHVKPKNFMLSLTWWKSHET